MVDSIPSGKLLRAVPASSVVSTELGDGIALLDLRSNEYFSLNEVGSLVWQALQTPRHRDDLVNEIAAQYEIEPAECSADIDTLLNDLWDAALVEVHQESPHQA